MLSSLTFGTFFSKCIFYLFSPQIFQWQYMSRSMFLMKYVSYDKWKSVFFLFIIVRETFCQHNHASYKSKLSHKKWGKQIKTTQKTAKDTDSNNGVKM